MGGPQLSRPYIAFGSLVFFLAFMYLSERGLDHRPFGTQHIGGWFGTVIAGCVFVLSVWPLLFRIVRPFI
jgi:hypothetical protein